MPRRDQLLRALADGAFHSGQDLAARLGVSRTAVWKQVQQLQQAFGLLVSAVRGRGYRLAGPLDLLDAASIRADLDADTVPWLDSLTVLATTASTNDCARADLPAAGRAARVWLAEHQTGGRGRRGRTWVSSFGRNIYLSLAWRFDLPMVRLAGLSLAVGVVVAETLAEFGLRGHALKWPNDVLVGDRKLAGVLVEVSGETDGPACAVIGIGINVQLSEAEAGAIDQPWVDLAHCGLGPVSRNRLAGRLVAGLIAAARLFADEGLAAFVARWEAYDRLRGQTVRVISGERHLEGTYRGIAASGAMLLETATGCTEHHAGEVSLRRSGPL